MKKINTIIFTCGLALVLTACGSSNKEDDTTKKIEDVTTSEESVTTNNDDSAEVDTNNTEDKETVTDVETTAENNFSYAEMKNLEFSFLSGVGGWSTDMHINADGTFEGTYHDWDMGSTGKKHPNGTCYYSEFKGSFGELQKIDDLTYKTTITDISYNKEPGTKEIIDGVLYRYSDAYGLTDAEDIIFYLPGTKSASLPESYLMWINSVLYDYESDEQLNELNFIGLFNEKAETGFYSVRMQKL